MWYRIRLRSHDVIVFINALDTSTSQVSQRTRLSGARGFSLVSTRWSVQYMRRARRQDSEDAPTCTFVRMRPWRTCRSVDSFNLYVHWMTELKFQLDNHPMQKWKDKRENDWAPNVFYTVLYHHSEIIRLRPRKTGPFLIAFSGELIQLQPANSLIYLSNYSAMCACKHKQCFGNSRLNI